MLSPPIINNELVIENLSRKKKVYHFIFDIDLIPEDELLWLIKQYKHVRKLVKQGLKPVDTVKELLKESEKIIAKGYSGNTGKILNPLLLDPALRTATHHLIDSYSVKNLGMWWCDFGSCGKYFTTDLCADPHLDCGAYGRRAIAFNPWSLDSISDLDTIIDSDGYHKEGTIGKSPFSFSRAKTSTSGSVMGSFIGASSTTIYSVILLIPSKYERDYGTSCNFPTPAPPDTCHSSYYASIYMPLWGWDVNVAVALDDIYSVKIKFYV